jgi:zinc transporter ZupT
MLFSINTWLLPAVTAAASSYLVCLAWEKLRYSSAPNGLLAAFLAGLSFLLGAVYACYRQTLFAPSLENNVIVMFVAGASATFFWLLLRKYLPGLKKEKRR